MTIIIDGHQVPERLERLAREGKWKAPKDNSVWEQFLALKHVMQPLFYSLEECDGKSLWSSEWSCYGQEVGTEKSKRLDEMFDRSKAFIIGDLGPERLLAVDLSVSASDPAVYALICSASGNPYWTEISPSLNNFLDALGFER